MKKKKYFFGCVACFAMLIMASVMVYAAGSGNSVTFNFSISTTGAGYSSDPVKKTAAVDAAYAKVTKNASGTIITSKKSTAFIVTTADGTQISSEYVLKGAGEASPIYNSTGKNYLADVCLRVNTAEAAISSSYTVKGTFYPNGS